MHVYITFAYDALKYVLHGQTLLLRNFDQNVVRHPPQLLLKGLRGPNHSQ